MSSLETIVPVDHNVSPTSSGVSSSYCRLPGPFLYLLAKIQHSLHIFCLFFGFDQSVELISIFDTPRGTQNVNLVQHNNKHLCAENHARHEKIMLFTVKELTAKWHFRSLYVMRPLSHNWKGEVRTGPLPTLLHRDSSHSLPVTWLESCSTSLNCAQSMIQPIII